MSEPTRERAATEEKSGARRDRERPPAPEPLPHPVVDNHCHLDIADGDWLATEEAIAAAAAVGVTRIVQIGCDLPGARWAVEAAADARRAGRRRRAAPQRGAAAGGRRRRSTRRWPRSSGSRSAHDKVRAVGETGLDHFRTGEDGRAAQEESFRRHIDLAKRLDKTLVIHDRDAHDDVLRVLDEEGAPERWVMHCFSGDADFARRLPRPRRPPVASPARSRSRTPQPLRDALVVAPRDRVLVETDAPYLTPDAVPRPAQRVLPGAAHDAGDGRGPRRRPRGALRGRRRQHRDRLRRRLVSRWVSDSS